MCVFAHTPVSVTGSVAVHQQDCDSGSSAGRKDTWFGHLMLFYLIKDHLVWP